MHRFKVNFISIWRFSCFEFISHFLVHIVSFFLDLLHFDLFSTAEKFKSFLDFHRKIRFNYSLLWFHRTIKKMYGHTENVYIVPILSDKNSFQLPNRLRESERQKEKKSNKSANLVYVCWRKSERKKKLVKWKRQKSRRKRKLFHSVDLSVRITFIRIKHEEQLISAEHTTACGEA